MPITYDVSANGTFVHFSGTGVLDLSDYRRILQRIAKDDRIKPGCRHLLDLTGMSNSLLTEQALNKLSILAKSSPKVTKNSRLAIVVSSGASFDRARYYEKTAQKNYQDIVVFNSMRTAKIWLGVEKNEFKEMNQ